MIKKTLILLTQEEQMPEITTQEQQMLKIPKKIKVVKLIIDFLVEKREVEGGRVERGLPPMITPLAK